MPRLDFNCDLGEGCGSDADIVPLISSASIACGAHAGDDATMRATIRLCREHGVAIGAHPSFEDREQFGRRELALDREEIARLVQSQLARLAAIADEAGTRIAHVKPHGALYNQAAADRTLAHAVALGVCDVSPTLRLVGLYQSQLIEAGAALGLPVWNEAFVDRAYRPDGTLVPRTDPGAVHADSTMSVAQALTLLLTGFVRANDGVTRVPVHPDTLCIHADTPGAVALARRLRVALAEKGIGVGNLMRPLTRSS